MTCLGGSLENIDPIGLGSENILPVAYWGKESSGFAVNGSVYCVKRLVGADCS
jgi:hypothetical protein